MAPVLHTHMQGTCRHGGRTLTKAWRSWITTRNRRQKLPPVSLRTWI